MSSTQARLESLLFRSDATMLYHPDDPLITWLRDGHLGGITLCDTREEVLEKWGPDLFAQAFGHVDSVDYGYAASLNSASVLRMSFHFHQHYVICLELAFRGGKDLQLPVEFGTPPYALTGQTTENEFCDLAQEHQIEVHFVEDHKFNGLTRKVFETRCGIHARFEWGVLHSIAASTLFD